MPRIVAPIARPSPVNRPAPSPGKNRLKVTHDVWGFDKGCPYEATHRGEKKCFKLLAEARDFASGNGYDGIKVEFN